MKIFQFPVSRILVCYTMGIISAFYTKLPLDILCYATIFSFILLILSPYLKSFACYLFFLFLGMSMLRWSFPLQNLHGKHSCICEVKAQKSKPSFEKFRLKCFNKQKDNFKCEVLWMDRKTMPVLGDIFNIDLELKHIIPKTKKTDFNYDSYLLKQGITCQSKVYAADRSHYRHIKRNHDPGGKIKSYYWKIYAEQLSENSAQLLPALVFGVKSEISKETLNLFSQAGIIHILAVSGLHVGMLYLLVFHGLFFLGKSVFSKNIRNGISLLVLILYAWICGFSASISRAVLMFALIFNARLYLKYSPTLHQLILSAFILLLIEPLWLFQVGFQLSYAATAGILIALEKGRRKLFTNKILLFIWESSLVSFSAQMAVSPLAFYYFKKIPVWFLFSNIPAFFLAFALLLFGLILPLSTNIPFLNKILKSSIDFLTELLFLLLNGIDKIPFTMLELTFESIFQIICSYILLTLWYHSFFNKRFQLLKYIPGTIALMLLYELCLDFF